MKNNKNKKGSHVGVVLSFVVFVTFIIFIYSALEPIIKTDRDKQFVLDYLEKELVKNFSNDLTLVTMSLNENYTPQSNCIDISHVKGVSGMNSLVKDKNDNLVESDSNNNSIEIVTTGIDGLKTFFKIYYTEEPLSLFPRTSANPCDNPIEGDNYSIGLVKTNTYLFQSRIIRLINIYNSDYEKLRDELTLPLGSDFGFIFKYGNGTLIGTNEKNLSISIYVNEIPIQYVDYEANIQSGSIIIKVW